MCPSDAVSQKWLACCSSPAGLSEGSHVGGQSDAVVCVSADNSEGSGFNLGGNYERINFSLTI